MIFTSAGHSYLHLPGVLMTESAGGATRYLLADGLGSIRHVTDEAGIVVGSQEFDLYGNPLAEPETAYGFTGEWWQDDVGLLHLRARWYDPASGTFLSRDAVESEPPYQYVRGNVVNYIDPTGNAPLPWDIGTRQMYSCKCGWIDWGHAEPQKQTLRQIRNNFDKDTQILLDPSKQIVGLRHIPARFSINWEQLTSDNVKDATSLGIFIAQLNAYEEDIQGNGPPPWSFSSWSAEDLPSNLIGFYRGLDELSNKGTPEQIKEKYMQVCGVVAFDLYKTNPAKFIIYQQQIYLEMGGFLGTQHYTWEPDQAHDGMVH